ncbi:transcriptional regulator, AsnC family [Tistlia consotensis]|uniref:Transcriptional regulator, AsnC family n=1 Tax=Tistlia consotensis USBA 355 TaxID=560819 RepID=A0A1Y6CP15_9PROT|nr:Lrp/AsnC family transcriptional regulator [Tistlia consotensis]SMF78564.1 transcriptional regulator, AsnC family [Tistlia consotensis USBA 355]SNS18741.1 transcriptional regulator, AsnC family [Tistlia consotensis]
MKSLRITIPLLDPLDRELVRLLAAEARLPLAELARRAGLSAPAVAERVRRLEEAGVIRGYGAEVDPAALGYGVAALVRVRPMPGQLAKVAELLDGFEEVVECDRVTGDDCFVARVNVASIEALETLIDRILPYATTNSSVIQSTPVPRRLPPLGAPPVAPPPRRNRRPA